MYGLFLCCLPKAVFIALYHNLIITSKDSSVKRNKITSISLFSVTLSAKLASDKDKKKKKALYTY